MGALECRNTSSFWHLSLRQDCSTNQLNGCFEMTRTLAVGSIATALALGLNGCAKPEVSEGNAKAVAPAAAAAPLDPRVAVADTARIQGNPAAKVWLVMASDFQCPACKHWHDTYAAEIMRDYVASGKVRFAYINFPLDQHLNARPASEAAMCAAAQGKFWGVHDRIFATQDEWAQTGDPIPHFRKIMTETGVDTAAWNNCLVEHVMVPLIDGDQARGRTGGVDQTPYFFIGERKVGGAIPADRMRPLLDAALAQAGTPPE
jgi:protein-disulfide isomerase